MIDLCDVKISDDSLKYLDVTHRESVKALEAAVIGIPDDGIQAAVDTLILFKQKLQRAAGENRGGFMWDNLTAADILDVLKERARRDRQKDA